MELNYKQFGSGEPLLILHGLFGSLDNWQGVAKELADQYEVFIIDLRNHGKSPHDEVFDYEIMADDIYQFIFQRGIDPVHLIGHSMGGKAAMQLALTHPSMIEKLIIVDINPGQSKRGHDAIFKALHAVNFDELDRRSDAEAMMEPFIPERDVRQFILKNIERNQQTKKYQWKFNLSAIFANYDEVLAAMPLGETFEQDCLFIAGGKSAYIQEEDAALITQLFPKAIIQTIKDAGHWVHAEQPKAFLEMVLQFLNDND